MRQYAGFGSAAESNKRYQFLLEAGPDGTLRRLRPADADRLRLGRPDGQRRGRQRRRRDRLARGHGDPVQGHSARQGLDVDDHQRHRGDAAPAVPAGRREAGLPSGKDHGHRAERHPQGVRRPRDVHLSAAALDAPRHRPVRLLRPRAPELEHDLDLRLSHPRGGLDRGRGDRVHAEPRDRLRRSGAVGRLVRGRLRPAPLLLLRGAHGLLRGGGQVSRGAAHVGAHHAGPLPREPTSARWRFAFTRRREGSR